MRIAIVRNHDHSGVINRFGRPCPERYGQKTVDNVMTALRDGGHDTLLCEGDKTLPSVLERFMPPDRDGRPTGLVFNMAYGIQGECRYTHVPAMLECHYAKPGRDKIAGMQAAGASDQSILDAFVQDKGKQALSVPPAEGFNLFNTPQLGQPGVTLGNAAFGIIGGTARANRQMQLGLKLVF